GGHALVAAVARVRGHGGRQQEVTDRGQYGEACTGEWSSAIPGGAVHPSISSGTGASPGRYDTGWTYPAATLCPWPKSFVWAAWRSRTGCSCTGRPHGPARSAPTTAS